MINYFKNLLYRYRVRNIKIDKLENINTKRNYLRSILNFIKVEDLIPVDDLKYIRIDTLFTDIDTYLNYLQDTFLNYDFTKPMPRHLLNLTTRKIYYIDFFVRSNTMLDVNEYLHYFIETYKELVDLIPYYDLQSEGYQFLNFKILDYYLTNMEAILIKVITSKFN